MDEARDGWIKEGVGGCLEGMDGCKKGCVDGGHRPFRLTRAIA